MTNYKTIRAFILSGLLLLLVNSCIKQPIPVYYYTLGDSELPVTSSNSSLPTIAVGPVDVASFLNQGQLITQNSRYSVTIEEQHRWAGNLKDMLTTVIISNLRHTLKTEKIHTFPISEKTEHLQLAINFTHFEKDSDGNALITAYWKVISEDGKNILYQKTSTLHTTPENNAFVALSKALSIGLSKLSNEIADRLKILTKA